MSYIKFRKIQLNENESIQDWFSENEYDLNTRYTFFNYNDDIEGEYIGNKPISIGKKVKEVILENTESWEECEYDDDYLVNQEIEQWFKDNYYQTDSEGKIINNTTLYVFLDYEREFLAEYTWYDFIIKKTAEEFGFGPGGVE